MWWNVQSATARDMPPRFHSNISHCHRCIIHLNDRHNLLSPLRYMNTVCLHASESVSVSVSSAMRVYVFQPHISLSSDKTSTGGYHFKSSLTEHKINFDWLIFILNIGVHCICPRVHTHIPYTLYRFDMKTRYNPGVQQQQFVGIELIQLCNEPDRCTHSVSALSKTLSIW